MKRHLSNRMAQPPPEWKPAAIAQTTVRAILCPKCGSARTRTRVTRPERGIVQMACLDCGSKFAVRGNDTASPEVR